MTVDINLELLIKKSKNGNLYVLYSDIKKLNLNTAETKKIILTLRRKGIQVKEDLGRIKSIHLGVDEYIDNFLFDEKFLPNLATIKYNKDGKIVYDFSELEKFIEEKLIPNHLIWYQNEISDDKFSAYIKLSDIVRFNFNCEEFKFIFNYLEKKHIMVRGYSKLFENEFNNYRYFERKSSNLLKNSKLLNEEEQNELLRQYKKTKDKKIKETLVLANIKLIKYVLSKINIKYNIDLKEYFSYGCEGLLEAIEKFNPNCGAKFVTFAYTCIKNAVYHGMRENLLFIKTYSLNYYRARALVEKINSISLENDLDLIDDVIDLMFDNKNINLKIRENYRMKILLSLNLNVDDYQDNELVDDSFIGKDVDLEILNKKIQSILSILSDNQREIVVLYFGLFGQTRMNLREIADLKKVSHQGIGQTLNVALKKIRENVDLEELSQYEYPELFEKLI